MASTISGRQAILNRAMQTITTAVLSIFWLELDKRMIVWVEGTMDNYTLARAIMLICTALIRRVDALHISVTL